MYFRYVFNWQYTFANKKVQVHEEYLLYDITGVIGSVGGTLGLFIGFSFWTFIGYITNGIKKFANKFIPLGLENGSTPTENSKVMLISAKNHSKVFDNSLNYVKPQDF